VLLADLRAGGRCPAPFPKAKKPWEKPPSLIGSWVFVQAKGDLPEVVITFASGGKARWGGNGVAEESGLYELRDGNRPPQIDIWPPARVVQGLPPMLCVYKVEGETLTIYYSNEVRPTALQKNANPRVYELVLKRRK
jgi:hypothetical protein